MYPSGIFPSYGIFVKNFCDQLKEIGIDYDLSVLTKTNNRIVKLFKYFLFYVKTFGMALCWRYKTVYIHYPSFSAAPVITARKFRSFEIFCNVHGTDVIPLKSAHERMIINTKKAVAVSQKIIVPSEYYKNLLIKEYKTISKKVTVYPSAGVNERLFHCYTNEKKTIIRKEYGLAEDTFVIGFVSRINKAKGWSVFLDAINNCDWYVDNKTTVFIVGSGEDDEELKERIQQLPEGIRNSIKRYPLLSQQKLVDIYNLLDIFVFPTMSQSESLGLVAIEAMACGVPVVASDYAAPSYYIVDGVNGFKFKKGNTKALTERINFLFHNRQHLKHLSSGAIETASHFNSSNAKNTLKEIMT